MNEKIFYEQLNNGLRVFVLPKPDFTYTHAYFTVNFGAKHTEFIPIGETEFIKVPNGLAHFLEHCKSEQDIRERPYSFFSKTGTYTNAATGKTFTRYEIYGCNNMYENIMFLLDYVQTPCFSDTNIEKEKKIIKEEISTSRDNVLRTGYKLSLDSTLVNSYYKNEILGSEEEINLITSDLLYKAYNTFYQPENMFLVVTGNVEPNQLMDLIRNNQEKKQFSNYIPPVVKTLEEPDYVFQKYVESELSINIPRVIYSLKIKRDTSSLGNTIKQDKYIFFIMDILFGGTSKIREILKQKGITKKDMMMGIIYDENFYILMLEADTELIDEFNMEIVNYLSSINISVEDLERKRNFALRNLMEKSDDIRTLNQYVFRNIITYDMEDISEYELIKSFNIEDLQRYIAGIDFSNNTLSVVRPIEKAIIKTL